MGQHTEAALPLAGGIGPTTEGTPEPSLVPGESGFGLPPLAEYPPVPAHLGLPIWSRAVPLMLRRPIQTARLSRCMFGSELWNGQFRGNPAPTVLSRQTWERVL